MRLSEDCALIIIIVCIQRLNHIIKAPVSLAMASSTWYDWVYLTAESRDDNYCILHTDA